MAAPAIDATPATVARKVEATIGSIFAFAVGLVVVIVGGSAVTMAVQSHDTPIIVLVSAVTIPLVALELLFLYTLKNALEVAHYPFAPWFALGRRRWPILARPVVAIWWLAHFGLGVGGAVLLDNVLVVSAKGWDVRLLRSIACVGLSFTVVYSANVYALLAITSLGFGPRWVNRLWRGRIVLDLTVAVVAGLFPFLSRTPAEPPGPPPITSRRPVPVVRASGAGSSDLRGDPQGRR